MLTKLIVIFYFFRKVGGKQKENIRQTSKGKEEELDCEIIINNINNITKDGSNIRRGT